MAKALKTAAIIVGVAALAIGTAGALAPVGTATFLGSLGVTAAASSVATVLGATAAALSFAAQVAMKKPSLSASASGSQERFTANKDQGVPYAMGRTAVAGFLNHQATWDYNGSKNSAYRTMFGVWGGGGPYEALESFLVDGQPVTFANGSATGAYANFMWLNTQLGAAPEARALAPAPFMASVPGWGSTAKMSGYAGFAWTLKFDPEGKKYPGGAVPKPLAVLKAAKVYDPRRDSTYPGGSGSCRALDEATYVWSENPWLHALTWALGRWQNGKRVLGIGMALASIDMGAAVYAANVADANSWKLGGVVYSTDDKWDVLKKICAAGGGEPLQLGGTLSFRVDTPRVSLATITTDQIIGDPEITTTSRMKHRINGVIPTYRSEDHDWSLVPAAQVQIADYVAVDRRPRTRAMTWELVQSAEQVAELATYAIVNAREFGPIVLPLKLRWAGYKPGDCLTIASDLCGLSNQLAIVTKRHLDPATGAVTLTLRSETAEKHAYALGQSGTAPPTPGLQVIDRGGLLYAGNPTYSDGTPIDDLRPAEPGSTNSANPDSPFGDTTVGNILNRVVDINDILAPSGPIQSAIDEIRQAIDDGAAGGVPTEIVTRIETLEADVDGVTTSLQNETDLRSNQFGSLGTRIDTLVSQMNGTAASGLRSSITTAQTVATGASRTADSAFSIADAAQGRADSAYTRAGTGITDAANAKARADSAYALANDAAGDFATISRQVTTLTSTINALGSPNLIDNGAFTNNFTGWTGFGVSWSLFNTGQFVFAQANMQANQNQGLYYDVPGIQEGKNYCLSYESENDSNVPGHMVVLWLNASKGEMSYGPETADTSLGWGNRIQVGPFKPPAGARYARVMFYVGRSGNGTRRVTKILFQQSNAPTPYVDGASVQALQAQVTSQAQTIATLSGKLGAYWQTQASAGDATAFVTVRAEVNGNTTSDVSIGAKKFWVYNDSNGQWLRTLEVSGGNVRIYGNLEVEGSVRLFNMKAGSFNWRTAGSWSGSVSAGPNGQIGPGAQTGTGTVSGHRLQGRVNVTGFRIANSGPNNGAGCTVYVSRYINGGWIRGDYVGDLSFGGATQQRGLDFSFYPQWSADAVSLGVTLIVWGDGSDNLAVQEITLSVENTAWK
jgi:hypothetical protein